MSRPAIEGHRRAGLQRFVTLAAERERHLALAIELKAAVVELTLQQHVAENRAQLLVAQTVAFERASCNVGTSHRSFRLAFSHSHGSQRSW